ncbi:MAG TPA: thiamine-phosphate kinase [Marmoricola sp.]|nr:thiamine-phosphate kinase [Marmoricola sp.]
MTASTLADLGEFALIDLLLEHFPQGEHVFLGPGDDAALVRTPRGHVVVAADMSVEGRHFRTDWAPALAIGRKAAAANLSDINAMGGRAHSLTLSLGAPPQTPTQFVLDLARGVAEEAALVGASVVGGDITSADSVIISISVLGTCDQAPVRRAGARPGDVLALAGRQGWAAAGLAVLSRGFNSPRVLVEAYQSPQVRYQAGPAAAVAGATAMLDISDGLVADARHLAGASGVDLDIRTEAFEVTEQMQAVGAAIGCDPMEFILSGGDDYPLLATFPEQTQLPDGFKVIGSVCAPTGEHPEVTVSGQAWEGSGGHRHFQG